MGIKGRDQSRVAASGKAAWGKSYQEANHPHQSAAASMLSAVSSGGVGAWPKGQDLDFFIAAVRAFERMNGRVADGRVKIDDGVSYSTAACRAGVIDSEVHVGSLSLEANGGPSRGSAKIVMLRGRSGALRWRLNRTTESGLCRAICRDRRARLSTDYPQISTASN
jgi:hypothetical protein